MDEDGRKRISSVKFETKWVDEADLEAVATEDAW